MHCNGVGKLTVLFYEFKLRKMNKEDYKKRIKQEFEKRNLNGFANHTILADLMADICTDVVKENCNLPFVSITEGEVPPILRKYRPLRR